MTGSKQIHFGKGLEKVEEDLGFNDLKQYDRLEAIFLDALMEVVESMIEHFEL